MRTPTFVNLILSAGLLSAFLNTGCKPVYFDQPQPKGVGNIDFPEPFRGMYLADKDTFWVEASGFVQSETYKDAYALEAEAELHPGLKRTEEPYGAGYLATLVDDEGPDWLGYWLIEKDTVSVSMSRRVRFYLSPDSMTLRPALNGVYLLSIRGDSPKLWSSLRLEEKAGGLELRLLTEDELGNARSFFQIREIRDVNGEIQHYLASPSPRKLRHFLESGGFAADIIRLEPIPRP